METSITILPCFSSPMDDTVNTCIVFNWTPHLIVKTVMGFRGTHVFLQCQRFEEERRNLEETRGKMLSPENVVRGVVPCQKGWD